MPLSFEWDEQKAGTKLAKHGVSFDEATTIFGDPRSLTIPDPAHSQTEDRFIILGCSHRQRLLVVAIQRAVIMCASSAPGPPAGANEGTMKKASEKKDEPEMRAEYDFSHGVRGKYARRYAQGTNVVRARTGCRQGVPQCGIGEPFTAGARGHHLGTNEATPLQVTHAQRADHGAAIKAFHRKARHTNSSDSLNP